MCSRGGLLDFENEEYMVFYLGRAQPPPSSRFYGVSPIMEFLSTGEKLFSLGPIYLLPQVKGSDGRGWDLHFKKLAVADGWEWIVWGHSRSRRLEGCCRGLCGIIMV